MPLYLVFMLVTFICVVPRQIFSTHAYLVFVYVCRIYWRDIFGENPNVKVDDTHRHIQTHAKKETAAMVRITKKRANNQRKNPCGFPLLPKYLYNSNSSAQILRWMRVRFGGLRIFRGFLPLLLSLFAPLPSIFWCTHTRTHFVMYNNKKSKKYLHIFTVYYLPKIFFTNIYITIEHRDTHIYTHTRDACIS